MRRAFTLIELLVVIAIMGVMAAAGVVSVMSGRLGAGVKGATRDIYAAIRHARSTALVTGQPAIITYSTVEEDGEPMARLEVMTAKLFDSTFDRSKVETFSGEPLPGVEPEEFELVHIEKKDAGKKGKSGKSAEDESAEAEGGETVEEILFAPVDASVVKGVRIKVVMDSDEEAAERATAGRPNKISVFSNVDYLLGRYKDARAADAKKKEEEAKAKSGSKEHETTGKVGEEPPQEPVSVVWETNGRVEPHRVWVYPDGKRPEDGLCIRIDRFGAAKVLSGDGREEE